MDPEIKRILDELKEKVGKNVDAAARIEQLTALATKGETDTKAIRAELELIKTGLVERDQKIRDLQAQRAVQAAAADPIREKREAFRMLGMIIRSEIARGQRMEIPADFRDEADLIRGYREKTIERATLYPGGTTGSYLVPTVTDANIFEAVEEVSDILGRVDLIDNLPSGRTFNFPYLKTRSTLQAARASVDTAMTASDPTFGNVALTMQEVYIYFGVDNALFQMSAVSLGQRFMAWLREFLVEGVANWAVVADASSTYNSIRGILADNTAAYIHTLAPGKTSFGDLAKSDLTGMKGKCLKRGRGAKGVFLMSNDILGVCEDMDRTGKTPVVRENPDGSPRILMNNVAINEDMPDLTDSAAGKGFIGFGDLATWLVGIVGGIQVASDGSYLFGKNQTAFRAIAQMDIQRKPVATWILGKTAGA